ncbi:uncharacterized protein LOC132262715 [Phlebotomus argentipes]|uniref:uncharacterized protein LOC132257160 n=1 Tax=Phlebotomus argentipes TaxID=94469 RepID=UPI0028933573|nr:uncharacterized protein LOC132257160 [Phlebotomus argentipes]XP_059618049.1 uncharacterized protein LOC132262715 [Phlebotomus argentipes]
MNKFVLFTFLFAAFVATNAQFFGAGDAFGPAMWSPWPQLVVEKAVQKVRDTPVSAELQPQLDQVVEDLEAGLAQCEELLPLNVYWFYKRCVGVQLKKASNAAAALEAASTAATTQAPA